MILMNLFAAQQGRCRHKEQIVETEGGEGGKIEKIALKYIYYHM